MALDASIRLQASPARPTPAAAVAAPRLAASDPGEEPLAEGGPASAAPADLAALGSRGAPGSGVRVNDPEGASASDSEEPLLPPQRLSGGGDSEGSLGSPRTPPASSFAPRLEPLLASPAAAAAAGAVTVARVLGEAAAAPLEVAAGAAAAAAAAVAGWRWAGVSALLLALCSACPASLTLFSTCRTCCFQLLELFFFARLPSIRSPLILRLLTPPALSPPASPHSLSARMQEAGPAAAAALEAAGFRLGALAFYAEQPEVKFQAAEFQASDSEEDELEAAAFALRTLAGARKPTKKWRGEE